MKILKYILLLLLALIVLGLVYVGTYDGKYDVKRSKVIKAPITHAFNTVNDLKTWEKWGPWHDEDSTIVVTYGDKTVGVGANNSWTSKDGPGSMKTISLEPNKSILQEITFMDGDPGGIYWNFEEVPEGTKVTWGMTAEKSPFMFKAIAAMMGGWDSMFGPMEENGLNNLEQVIIETIPETPKFSLGNVSTKEVDAKTFIGYHHKVKIDHENMTKLFMQDMPKAGIYAAKSGLKLGDYTPGAVFSKYDETTNETEFFIGLLLNTKLAPAEGMQVVNLPKGKAVTISKFGNYGVGDQEAHVAIDNYILTNNYERTWPIWELYVNDPGQVSPEKIQTDIYYPLK